MVENENIDKDNIHIPNGMAELIEEECRRYDELIKDLKDTNIQMVQFANELKKLT